MNNFPNRKKTNVGFEPPTLGINQRRKNPNLVKANNQT